MKEVILGEELAFGVLPAEVEIDNRPFYLLKDEEGYRLLSRTCPHAGYPVEFEDGELVCPLHGWTFEYHSGRCQNVPSTGLDSYSVTIVEGRLVARLEG
ncbi:Rieske (2Fe-2S) protein [Paenibacillus sp. CC-CFT747]|nr:Rieske (2Fe-2S) protein [Paenibacillus sp. CC-CFT747]